MQKTGYRNARYVLKVITAALTLCFICTPLRAEDDQLILQRAFQIGVTDEIRKKSAEPLSPHLGRLHLDGSDVAEIGDPPPPSGLKVYRSFYSNVTERFRIAPLSVCQVSQTDVHCPTSYLPDYNRVFLVMNYSHIKSKQMSVSVDVIQRGTEGHLSPGTSSLSHEDKLAIAEIFDSLLTEAMGR